MGRAGAPLVFGGDLNENARGASWHIVAGGLVDAAEAKGCGDRLTFSCANPRARSDALFGDPRLEIPRNDVIHTPLARRASDHFPILVDLEVPEA